MIKKIAFVLISVAILTTFIAFTDTPKQEKENVYTLSEGQMMMLYNTNIQVKQILPTSQAPAITVTQINYNLDSIQNVLVTQWKNFHPDTLAPKKK